MRPSAPLVSFLLVLAAKHASACYYSALNLENPADYYYRYCYAGCVNLEPTQEVFAACCTPLAIGATAPPACATASSSLMEQGSSCVWTSVPTSDFPSDYGYATTPVTSSTEVTATTTSSGVEAGSTDSSDALPPPPPETSPITTRVSTTPPPPPPPSPSPSSSAPPPPPTSSEEQPPAPTPSTESEPAPPPHTNTKTVRPKTHPTVPVPHTQSKYKNCWCDKDKGDEVTTCEDKDGKKWHQTKGAW